MCTNKATPLVTHRLPDFDAISTVFGDVHLEGYTIFDVIQKKVPVIFVQQGEGYQAMPGENPHVLDTGSVYDPRTGKFDHHYPNTPHHCALHGLVEYHRGLGREIPVWLEVLVDRDCQVDDNQNYPKDHEFGVWIRMANEALQSLFRLEDGRRLPLRFMENKPGPEWLVTSLKQFPKMSDEERMNLGLIMLETWKRVFETGELVDPLDELNLVVDENCSDDFIFPPNEFIPQSDRECRGINFNYRRPIVVLPDAECAPTGLDILALKLFMLAMSNMTKRQFELQCSLSLDDVDIRFGEVGDVPDGVSVVEIGPDNRFVVDGVDYSSETRASALGSIFDAMYKHDRSTPLVIWNLVKYAEYMSYNGDITISPATADKIVEIFKSIDPSVSKNMKFIAGHNAPVNTLNFIDSLGVMGCLSNSAIVGIGIILLEGFFDEIVGRKEIYELVKTGRFSKSHGLSIGYFPKSVYSPKDLRGVLRGPKFRDDRLDIMVGEFECNDNNPICKFGVTITGQTCNVVGMDQLFERLHQLDPELARAIVDAEGKPVKQGDIFLHHSKFTMYVQNWETSITIEQLESAVAEILRYISKEEYDRLKLTLPQRLKSLYPSLKVLKDEDMAKLPLHDFLYAIRVLEEEGNRFLDDDEIDQVIAPIAPPLVEKLMERLAKEAAAKEAADAIVAAVA